MGRLLLFIKGGVRRVLKVAEATSTNVATATATVKDNSVIVKGVAAGTAQVVIKDKDNKTTTVSVTVR